jgi:carbamoyl-phosphate synthase large subunit
MDKRSILIFGVGELQRSIIIKAKDMGLFVVGIDPCADAACRNDVDVFEIVGGQDFEGTLAVAKKYSISALVTAATDKPLVMMAMVAKALDLPFYTEDTAVWSTDKYQMKQRFIDGGVPCARGRLVHHSDEANDLYFPIICKPRDNSGSRGVKLCRNIEELQECIDEALQYSRMDTVLVEEFIEGKEYSIESLHYKGKCEVIQFTEKRTTPFPYNVELGHVQPANLSEAQKDSIRNIINKIASCMKFENCPSHTELKINDRGIFVIETSPRLGGDYITSTLTPLSTGVNLEEQLINIAMGCDVDTSHKLNQYSGIRFFSFDTDSVINRVPDYNFVISWPHVVDYSFKLSVNDRVNPITSSLNRYGHIILQTGSRESLDDAFDKYEAIIKETCLSD